MGVPSLKPDAQNTRIKDFEPMDFLFYYDQLVVNVDWNGGHLGRITLPIFTCELDDAPGYPDTDQAVTSEYSMLRGGGDDSARD